MLTKANQEADQIRMNALLYTNDLLKAAEFSLENAYLASMEHYRGLTQTLKVNLDVVKANRAELGVDNVDISKIGEQVTPEDEVNALIAEMQAEKENEDFDFEDDEF